MKRDGEGLVRRGYEDFPCILMAPAFLAGSITGQTLQDFLEDILRIATRQRQPEPSLESRLMIPFASMERANKRTSNAPEAEINHCENGGTVRAGERFTT